MHNLMYIRMDVYVHMLHAGFNILYYIFKLLNFIIFKII